MRITSLALAGMRGWPDIELPALSAGLNVFTGPLGSGKTTLAEFLAHVLFGKLPETAAGEPSVPEGDAIVEGGGSRYRLRRYHDGTALGRLTVASLNGEPVDRDTVQRLLGNLSPTLLSRLFAVGFGDALQIDRLFAAEFAREFQSLAGNSAAEPGRKATELAARRDALAQELETRIAGERRASGELEQHRRDLERRIRDGERNAAALELRLRAVETALAETDARLRYRRLELNTELRWHSAEAADWEPQLAELDEQIARWRATLADMARREASVRSKLAQLGADGAVEVALADQQAWTAVARQLAADLEGEVARLARATASQQCVCRESHPRLRPIVETLSRQLNVLESLHERQQLAASAADSTREADHLARSQAELRRQLEYLLDRRQTLLRDVPSRRRTAADHASQLLQCDSGVAGDLSRSFSAADAEQLEERRLELEQERFELVERLRKEQGALRLLRSQRADTERQRAGLLSARSIEHVQRELAAVQRKLEQVANQTHLNGDREYSSDRPWRASDFLAQLTDGRLVRLELADGGRQAWAVRASGETVAFDSLTAAERDQVHLAFALALVLAAGRKGVHLPLLLDEPFAHLDARDTAALAAVLEDFGRQGHQVLVFTGRKEAVERLASLGAMTHELTSLRRWKRDAVPVPTHAESPRSASHMPTSFEPQVAPPRLSRKKKDRAGPFGSKRPETRQERAQKDS